MSGSVGRALFAVLAVLCANALGLLLLGSWLAVAIAPGFWLALLGALVLGCGLAFAATAPLRADLLVLRSHARSGGEQDTVPPARAAESEPLLQGLARLRSSFAELEAVQSEARRETLEAERLRTAFLAAMGHDLRGPLNSLIGFSDLLALEGLDTVAASLRPSVEIIRRSARDLLVLLDEILGWAKFEAGHIALDPVKTPLDEIVGEVANEARQRSGDRGLTVQCSVASNLPEVEVDRKRIVEALLGLLDHATRAPERPRVSVSVWLATDEQQRASMRLELRDPQLCIREADQRHFFEAFRPSYAPSGKRVAGLGLGPALARALIRAHGGEVWFSSDTENGTTFVVDLPLAFDHALQHAS